MSGLTDRQKVLDWIASTGETDQDLIDEVINACREDRDTRKYYVERYHQAVIDGGVGNNVLENSIKG